MNRDSTISNLIRYIYHETDMRESEAIRRMLAMDEELREEYHEMRRMSKMLDRLVYNPSPTSVNIILNHSRKLGKLEAV
jgi:hypothetical protein